MSTKAVNLDDEPPVAPEEVDEESAHAHVHFGLREMMPAAQSEEPALQLAAGVIGLELLINREA